MNCEILHLLCSGEVLFERFPCFNCTLDRFLQRGCILFNRTFVREFRESDLSQIILGRFRQAFLEQVNSEFEVLCRSNNGGRMMATYQAQDLFSQMFPISQEMEHKCPDSVCRSVISGADLTRI